MKLWNKILTRVRFRKLKKLVDYVATHETTNVDWPCKNIFVWFSKFGDQYTVKFSSSEKDSDISYVGSWVEMAQILLHCQKVYKAFNTITDPDKRVAEIYRIVNMRFNSALDDLNSSIYKTDRFHKFAQKMEDLIIVNGER